MIAAFPEAIGGHREDEEGIVMEEFARKNGERVLDLWTERLTFERART